ncbi:hypothetical protein CHS0354_036398 [Potamilus streckersoni]|uniref:Uncharacterized protein n=1 Tax=Potamilus streckersoni TaxID=2493646 RepID=A0AAE0W3R0_9BIVA|nr:hypothetical protein CHS0354_036398 [Potamilus streckersoni]
MTSLLLIAILPLTVQGFLFKQTKWDNLRVTWGMNPFNPYNYASMPRTEVDAKSEGFVMKSDCNARTNFVGKRYWKSNDPSVMLLYDVNGFIAGIQIGIAKDLKTGSGEKYPFQKQINAPFVDDGDLYLVTAYFTNPATICTSGRSQSDFNTHGTGEHLYIQNGTHPTDVITVPTHETEVAATRWTKGKCFPSMGVHYWYNLRADMPCNEFFPVFLLYNEGELNAFGWALGTNIAGTQRLEHPPQSSYSKFMETVPTCLYQQGTLTTLHIYMTTHYELDLC